MVGGCAMAVTAVPRMYQCAEMARIAFGLPNLRPAADHASVCRLRSSVFIGLPCPRKTAGARLGCKHDVPHDRDRVGLGCLGAIDEAAGGREAIVAAQVAIKAVALVHRFAFEEHLRR